MVREEAGSRVGFFMYKPLPAYFLTPQKSNHNQSDLGRAICACYGQNRNISRYNHLVQTMPAACPAYQRDKVSKKSLKIAGYLQKF